MNGTACSFSKKSYHLSCSRSYIPAKLSKSLKNPHRYMKRRGYISEKITMDMMCIFRWAYCRSMRCWQASRAAEKLTACCTCHLSSPDPQIIFLFLCWNRQKKSTGLWHIIQTFRSWWCFPPAHRGPSL